MIHGAIEKEYSKQYVVKIRNKKFLIYTTKDLNFGDVINIKGRYKAPERNRNYKGFNYQEYLKTKEIYGTIDATNIERIGKNNGNKFINCTNTIKERIINKIQRILPNETENLLIGILLGDKQNLNEDIVDSFKKSSLSHVLAVSGMHASYIIIRCYIYTK